MTFLLTRAGPAKLNTDGISATQRTLVHVSTFNEFMIERL